MTMEPAAAREVISFGPFSLVTSERLLTKDGAPVELGARALDLLVALVTHPNEIMSKPDLLAQVWSDIFVEEGSLRFHVAALRKVLGDGENGARYIATLAGRGYCFVAPVSRSREEITVETTGAPSQGVTFLPATLTRMVGRTDGIRTISDQLAASRFVTIVGAGGAGKPRSPSQSGIICWTRSPGLSCSSISVC